MKTIKIYRQSGLFRMALLLCLFLSLSCSLVWAQTSTVVIAEIMYDNPLQDNEAVRSGVNGEFLSLYNYGDNDVNVGGWRIEITNMSTSARYVYTIPTGTILPSMGLAIIASRTSSTFNVVTFYDTDETEGESDMVLYTSSLAFPDTRSRVSVYNAQRVLEDEVTYDGNSVALSGQILLRAKNNVNSLRPLSQTTSIQRKRIVVTEWGRVISRNDYYPATPTHTVQLFGYTPEEYSSTAPISAYSAPPANRTLVGTVTENSDERATTIKSTQAISSGKTTYWAEEEIVLNPGFEVKNGAEFTAFINRDSVNLIMMLTYNLWQSTDYDKHAKIIKDAKANVASIQEVRRKVRFDKLKESSGLSGSMCATRNVFGYKYGIGVLWDKSVVGDPTISNKIMKVDKNIDKDKKRAFIVAEFDNFCFVATHYSLSSTDRAKMSDSILSHNIVTKCINSGKPVYIAGDMNAVKEDAPIKKFTDYGFEVLNTPVGKDAKTGARFIDFILEYNTNPYHKMLNTGVPIDDFDQWNADKISDHYPYFVRVKVK